jgi:hypothetical protein
VVKPSEFIVWKNLYAIIVGALARKRICVSRVAHKVESNWKIHPSGIWRKSFEGDVHL